MVLKCRKHLEDASVRAIVAFLIITLTIGLGLGQACSNSGGYSGNSAQNTNSRVSGKLSDRTLPPATNLQPQSAPLGKTITHIMAVAPSTSRTERFLAEVKEDGSFTLNLNSGQPYLIVFVAQNGVLTGPDMIAGTLHLGANHLDTLPIKESMQVELGDIALNQNQVTANSTLSTSTAEILSKLGISNLEANYLGAADDLALRLANPDIDMNGMIDTLEGKSFGLDWHVRADTKVAGRDLMITQIENQFANENLLTLSWTHGSAYAVYPRVFDDSEYTSGGALSGSGNFLDSGATNSPASFSGNTFADKRQWGPDYNLTIEELGASQGHSTFTYTLGTKALKFSHVRTKSKNELSANGVLLPFIKINTIQGRITGIGYKWMKRYGSNWTEASSTEVALLVQEESALLRLYTAKTPNSESSLNFSIPNTPASGIINVGGPKNENFGVDDIQNVQITDICNIALSYDDKLGLRIFAGAPLPDTSITPCQ